MSIELKIHIFQGNEFSLPPIPITATVLELKKKISEIKGFSVEQQLLSIPKRDYRLKDQCQLKELPHFSSLHKATLKLTLFHRLIPVRIIRPEQSINDLIIKIYPCCTISHLKDIIEKQAGITAATQSLYFNGILLGNEKLLSDYNIRDQEDSMNCSSIEEAHATTTTRPFEIHLFARAHKKGKMSLGIDFSFNTIKNVKKVGWTEDAPWFREVTDGLSWFCYCRNSRCPIFNQMFVINAGFGHLFLENEMKKMSCPVCHRSSIELRNIGFVNCIWQYKGILANRKDSKVVGDGRTYDGKLYTFKETNYKTMWDSLELLAKHLEGRTAIRNLSVQSEEEEEKEKEEKKEKVKIEGCEAMVFKQNIEGGCAKDCTAKAGYCSII